MRVLVTAGNTAIPIDQVREITNIFTGRTGAAIALEAYRRGHDVTLLTSHPETAATAVTSSVVGGRWSVVAYHTFDELMAAMETVIRETAPDAIVHSAAVSDFRVAGVYVPAPGTRAAATEKGLTWEGDHGAPRFVDATAGKVKSGAPEVWLRLTPAPKIIDRIRAEWAYRGILVKFKLEVGVDEARLLEVAETSRRHSRADLMVANMRETVREWAYIGPDHASRSVEPPARPAPRRGAPDGYRRVPRAELPSRLIAGIEELSKG